MKIDLIWPVSLKLKKLLTLPRARAGTKIVCDCGVSEYRKGSRGTELDSDNFEFLLLTAIASVLLVKEDYC